MSKEIERRTIYTIMARPISRAQFVVGKYAGLAMTLLVTIGIMFVVFLFTLWTAGAPIHGSLFQAPRKWQKGSLEDLFLKQTG